MLKPISKIAVILFLTFLSGLVMTDSVLPELQNEERAEIEIEEEEEIEISNLIQSEFITECEDGGGKNKIVIAQSILQNSIVIKDLIDAQIQVKSEIKSIEQSIKTPLYILYCELKLNL